MNWDKIEVLLQKYYEGETTVAEEAQLRIFFSESAQVPDHLKPHTTSFQYFAQQQEEQLDKRLSDEWLFEKIEEEAPEQGKRLFFPSNRLITYWGFAASILLLIGAFWAGIHFRQSASIAQTAEVAALRHEVQELKEVLLASTSASERISVVSQQFSTNPDDELIQVLIRTMNTDPNVNVRLASAEALLQHSDNALVRQAFTKSLKIQTDPLIQIALIDMLVSLKEKKAVDELTQLAQRKDLLPIVKNKAQEGIGILI